MTEHEYHAMMLKVAREFRTLADEIDFEYAKWLTSQSATEPEFCYLSRDDEQRFDEVCDAYERTGGYY